MPEAPASEDSEASGLAAMANPRDSTSEEERFGFGARGAWGGEGGREADGTSVHVRRGWRMTEIHVFMVSSLPIES